MSTPRELLADAERELAAAGLGSPRVDAELLLAHVTQRPRALLRLSGELPAEQVAAFTTLVAQRVERVPLQHLTGTAPFRHLELLVGPGVFVPRPETELLVDAVLAHLSADVSRASRPTAAEDRLTMVDLCTGSAALALALATEVPGSHVWAVEVDPAAAAWAARNVDRTTDVVHRAGSTVRLMVADATTVAGGALAHLKGRVEVVVTNPPYVPDDAIPRDPEVRDHDPALALFGGPDGLDVVRLLVGQAALLLRPGGLLAVEHADLQGEDAHDAGVPALLRASPDWSDVADHRDLTGLPRFTTAVRAEVRRAEWEPGDVARPAMGAADLGPAGVGPVGVGPVGVGPAGVGPVGVGPAGVGPAGVGPAGVGPVGVGPADVGPVDVAPADVAPDDPVPAASELVASELAALDPVALGPAAAEPADSEPVDSEPADSEPAEVEHPEVEPAGPQPNPGDAQAPKRHGEGT